MLTHNYIATESLLPHLITSPASTSDPGAPTAPTADRQKVPGTEFSVTERNSGAMMGTSFTSRMRMDTMAKPDMVVGAGASSVTCTYT